VSVGAAADVRWWMGREQSWTYAATNQRVAVGRQQAPGQNHRADPTDSNGDGLANTDHVGVGRPLGLIHGKERETLQVVHGISH
jgi:hypothetical protein